MSVQPLHLYKCDVCRAEETGPSIPPEWGEAADERDKIYHMCGECISGWSVFEKAQKDRAALKAKPASKGKR